jgi:hypothetical membrane protein
MLVFIVFEKLRKLNFLKISGFLTIITFFLITSISIMLYNNYDFFGQNFSDLGVGQTSIIFNFGIMLTAIFLTIYYYFFFLKKNNSIKLFLLGFLSTIGLFGVGFFDSQSQLHFIFAGLFFISTFVLIMSFLLKNRLKILGKDFKKLALFSLIFLALIIIYIIFRTPFFQKIAVYSIVLWNILLYFNMPK